MTIKLDHNDQLMCDWAYEYLKKTVPSHYQGQYETKLGFCDRFIKNCSDQVFLNKMGNAWRGYKYKAKKRKEGKNSYTFFLSKRSFKSLQKLASDADTSTDEALEMMINGMYRYYRDQKTLTRSSKKKKPTTSIQKSNKQEDASQPFLHKQ